MFKKFPLTHFQGIKKIYKVFVIFKRAYWQYRWRILGTTLLGFASSLMGGLGISMLIPLFVFITQQNNADSPNYFSQIVERILLSIHLSFNLPLLLSLIVLLFAAKAIINVTAIHFSDRISSRYDRDTSSLLFKETLESDWVFLINQKVGYLDRIISGDVGASANILRAISELMLRTASLITYAFIAFKISPSITLLSLMGGAVILLVLKPVFFKARKLATHVNITNKKLSHLINESLIGIKTLKAFAVEPSVAKKGSLYFDELRKARVKASLISSLQGVLFEPVSLLFISIIFVYSFKSPDFNIASFAVIIYLIQKMYTFIQGIQGKLDSINSSFTYLDTMLHYKKSVEQYKERTFGTQPFKFEKTINIHGIGFAYPNIKLNTLSDITFTIQKGEMIGIIGPSGAGKTTLVDILLQLLKPQKGVIEIDNINVASISLADWRKNIGYVSQDVFLLNDTIENNIRFYDEAISRENIANASKMANIYDFIQELPNKFETQVGERGIKLSGGQRQRVALARVLAKKSSILILDEATSSIDNESEALIQKAINDLKGKVTVLVIAHRLSTVMNSDRIIVIDNGQLVESGVPDELIKNTDSYLYKSYHIKDQEIG